MTVTHLPIAQSPAGSAWRSAPSSRPSCEVLWLPVAPSPARPPEEEAELLLGGAGEVELMSRPARRWLAWPGVRDVLVASIRWLGRAGDEAVSSTPVQVPLSCGAARVVRLEGRGGPRYLVRLVPHRRALAHLTAQQREIADAAAAGATNAEIARSVGLSINTVKYHLKAVYEVLGVATRLELREALGT